MVEWFKVKALSSSPSTEKAKNKKPSKKSGNISKEKRKST
jgi:hypothetical protein